jgi:LmbE family N-acetylglucosaminyl deacetylase
MTIRLLGLFAHPDDDVYTLGATLASHVEDVESTLVFATSGEAGPITDPVAVPRERLGEVREGEQSAAMAALGIDRATHARFLRLPDYFLPDVPIEELTGAIEAIIRDVAPDVVVTFGPDGMTSHHDHIRVGEACTEAFDRTRGPAALFHVALPRSAVGRFYADLAELNTSYGGEGTLFNVVGVPDERITVRVDARPFQGTKLAAIMAHRTQVCEWERIPAPLRWIFLDEEAFVQARPPVHPGSRTDLFAGLHSPSRS